MDFKYKIFLSLIPGNNQNDSLLNLNLKNKQLFEEFDQIY